MSNKRYELLRDLPDYKAGEIFTWDDEHKHYYASNKDKLGEVGKWPARYVENNPDWFREIVQRDFEIVAMKHPNGVEHKLRAKDEIKYRGGMSCEEQGCKIHSVRRMADGIVFSVGDAVEYGKDRRRLIIGFDIYNHPDEGEMCRAILNIHATAHTDSVYYNIKSIEKYPAPQPEQPKQEFQWTDELVLMYGDLCHHYGYHRFAGRKEVINQLHAIKAQCSRGGYQFADWIKEALQSKSNSQPKSKIKFQKSMPDKFDGGRANPMTIDESLQFTQKVSKSKERIEVEMNKCVIIGNRITIRLKSNVPAGMDIKFPAIKEAIEQVLNDDGKVWVSGKEYFTKNYENLPPHLKLYTAKELEEAEKAAFESARLHHPMAGLKFDTFEDYKKFQNQKPLKG